jgi:hypothetical protein
MEDHQTSAENAPRMIPKLSICTGFALMLFWMGYVMYLMVTTLELPDGGEILDVAGVALVMFGLGWATVRLGSYSLTRVHRRVFSNGVMAAKTK